jgi:hypothetical protein
MLATVTIARAAPKAAIFPFELIDTILEGELGGARQDEARRLVLVTQGSSVSLWCAMAAMSLSS